MATLMRSLRVSAPAKINLFLRVLGRRPDGYHDLETLFQEIDLSDELIFRETVGETSLEVPGHTDLENRDNLVTKALRWIENRIERKLHVAITLRKRIPSAAGLGGGSSDAAATLKGIASFFSLDLGPEDLAEAAISLGADVPFFLKGGAAVGEGVGEKLTPVNLPNDYELLLVNPGFPVSTAAIFREYSKILTANTREGRLWPVLHSTRSVRDLLHNDLQSVAERLHPEISEVLREMERSGLRDSLMTGSGPTVFGLAQPGEIGRTKTGHFEKWTKIVARPSNHGIVID
jgi:4-diphosphocytidyl-2-C-methyl-D-erythritol kinase